eukprot:CAMPEP_0198274958 /NCGR_PEP_ID=MMETSP1447-20131203/62563_1 /TAXON_ID=420782 /ORGANISM="Chaetoceros dichaeta, Strain CCMP1751" /LENGTH=767 /DNA_ID=CAMNT_0043969465 /DNA_START=233 /DNA_END=2536 /DNA_ORIENTATION=+
MTKSCQHKKPDFNHANTQRNYGKGSRSKIIPFPFLSPTLSEKKILRGGNRHVPNALRRLTRTLSNTNVMHFSRSSLSQVQMTEQVALLPSHPLRCGSESLLMNAKESIVTGHHQVPQAPHTTMGNLYNRSPPSVRRGWTTDCNIDGKEVEHMTLPMPSALKKIDIKMAERQALSAFGTTPALIIEAQDRRRRVKKKNSSKTTTTASHQSLSVDQPSQEKNIPASSTQLKTTSKPTIHNLDNIPKSLNQNVKVGAVIKDDTTFTPSVPSGKLEPKSFGSSTSNSITNMKKNLDNLEASGSTLPESKSIALNNEGETPFGTKSNNLSTGGQQSTDYHQIMTQFYQKHNAAKLGEVTKTLQKYKGKEIQLFEKLAKKYGVSNPLRAPTKGATKHVSSEHAAMHKERNPIESQTIDSTGEPDYHNVLSQFYQKYNPSKIGEVAKTLHRYKGYEPKMFAKLAQKYNAPNPLVHSMDLSASTVSRSNANLSSSNQTLTPPSDSSLFGPPRSNPPSMQSPFGSSSSQNVPAFGGISSTTFGNTLTPTKDPFGAPSTQTSTASFGYESNTKAPFGQISVSTSTPFGVNQPSSAISGSPNFAGQSPAPFVVNPPSTAISASTNFAQKSARELLLAFYQQHNPTKVSEVDKVLVKYAGQEEQMFRNLAKKYNVDPTLFGLNSAAAGSFGQSGGLGSPSPFGQTSGLTGTTAGGFGSQSQGGFGNSFAQPGHVTGGFASLAATSPTPASNTGGFSPFNVASPAPPTFGSPTPFGAARR